MNRSWISRLLVGLTVVVMAGCTQSPPPNRDAAAEDETSTVAVSEVALADGPAKPNQVGQSTASPEHELAPDEARDEAFIESAAEETAEETAETTFEINKLAIGDAAPPLAITHWVKGSQVDAFEQGRIYVVEFWATWCGPCKAGMPHISQLQRQYQNDVTFIGVSNEDIETVEDFFASQQSEEKTWDEVADYTFAIDGDKATGRAYMEAAGQSGIPTAFVVGSDGHVEWIGHPMEIDQPIETLVNGQWDRMAFAKRFEAERAAEEALQAAIPQLRPLMADEKWDEALEIFDELASQFPGDSNIGEIRANVLLNAGRAADGVVALHDVAKANWDDANRLNGISWALATKIPEEARDLDVALEIAQRANDLTQEKNPSILDTIARVYYEQAALDQAISWQEKALALSEGNAALQATLDDYVRERDGGDQNSEEGGADKEGGAESADAEVNEDA